MSDVNANIGIQIDSSLALAELKNLQRQLANFHSSISKSSAAAAIAQKNLQSNLVNSINETGKFRAQMGVIRTSTESFTDALEKNKFSMREYFRYAGGATKTFGRMFRSEFDTIHRVATERVKDLQTQYIKMGRDANGAMRAISVRPLALDMENYATKAQLAAQKQALFSQLLKQGSTNLLNFGKNTQWAGRQLMVGFTIPLMYFGTAASKVFMNLEAQAIKFKRVYGGMFTSTEESAKALKDIESLAKEFTKYGVAVTNTMEMAAKAAAMGKVGAELTAQVAEATRLAVLGGVEQEQALDTTISLTNAFGLAAEDLTGKINFLNAVENQTVTAIEDLTIAIPKAGPIVQQLGGSVEDLAFFLTAMREGGINASEAANALKSGLASLINPTKKASQMLMDMGININAIVEGNKGDLKQTIIDFADALDTLAPLERARAIEQLFGKFQFARLSTLFENVNKEGTQAAKVLDLAGRSVEELAILSERELKTVEDAVGTNFKAAVEELKLAIAPIGKVFLETVTPILRIIGDWLEKFNNLGDGTKKFIVVATTLLGLIGPTFLMTFGLVANGVANLIKLFGSLRSGFLRLTGDSKSLGLQTQYLTTEQTEAATIAAALNQSHNKLIQTFTVEASAVAALRNAYVSATVAARNFAAANPGMLGKIGGIKGGGSTKFASGTTEVVGGQAGKDSVPALLMPGEAVIPTDIAQDDKFKPLIAALVTGEIAKYGDGTTGVEFGDRVYNAKSAKVAKNIKNFLDSLIKNQDGTLTYVDPKSKSTTTFTQSKLREVLDGRYARIDADKFNVTEIKEKLSLGSTPKGSGISSSKGWISTLTQKAGYPNTLEEKAAIEKYFKEKGINPTQAQRQNLFQTQASHIIEEKGPDGKKIFRAANIVPDAGWVNNYLNTVKGRLGQDLMRLNDAQLKELGIERTYLKDLVDGKHPTTGKAAGTLANIARYQLSNDPRNYQAQAVVAGMEYRGSSKYYPASGSIKTLAQLFPDNPKVIAELKKQTLAAVTKDEVRVRNGVATPVTQVPGTRKKKSNERSLPANKKDKYVTKLGPKDYIAKIAGIKGSNIRYMPGYADTPYVVPPGFKGGGSGDVAPKRLTQSMENLTDANNESAKASRTMGQKFMVGANVATGLAVAGSMAGGKLGELSQKLMGPLILFSTIGMIAPSLKSGFLKLAGFLIANPYVALVAAVVAVAFSLKKANDNAKKLAESTSELTKQQLATAERMKQVGTITNKVGATELQAKRNEMGTSNRFTTGYERGSTQFGTTFLESEFGKEMYENFVNSLTKGGTKAVKTIALELGSYVSDGIMTAEQAFSIARSIGINLQDMTVAAKIRGQLIELIGPDGKDAFKDGINLRTKLIEGSKETTQTAIQNASLGASDVGGLFYDDEDIKNIGILAATSAQHLQTITSQIAASRKSAEDRIKELETEKLKTKNAKEIKKINEQINTIKKEQSAEETKLQKQYKEGLDLQVKGYKTATAGLRRFGPAGAAFHAAQEKGIRKRYKGTGNESTAEAFIKAAKGTKSQVFEVKLKAMVEGGVFEAKTLTDLLGIYGKDGEGKAEAMLDLALTKKDPDKIADLISTVTGFKDKALSQKIIVEATSEDGLKGKKLEKRLEVIERLQTLNNKEVNVEAFIKTDGLAGLDQLYKQLDFVENIDGPIDANVVATIDTKSNDPTMPNMDALVERWKEYDGLKDETKKSVIQEYISIYRTITDNEAKSSLLKRGITGRAQTPEAIKAEKETIAASLITQAGKYKEGEKTKTKTGDSEVKDRDTTYDDLLKRLRAVRNANIDIEGGLGVLTSKFKKTGGEGWKAFKGIENAMLNVNTVGKNREFINYLSSLDKKAYATYVNMDKLKKGVFQLTPAGKALEMAFNDAKIGEYVVAQQEAAKATNAQRKAFTLLVQNGMPAALAMETVADAEMAVAINSKAAKGELKGVVNELIKADNVTKRNAFVEFLRKGNIDIEKKLNIAKVIPQMKALGMTSEQIQEALDNPTIMDGLIAGLKDGKVQAQDVLDLIEQIAQTRRTKIIIDVETRSSVEVANDAFQDFKSRFDAVYDAQSALVDFELQKKIDASNAEYDKAVADAEGAYDAAISGRDAGAGTNLSALQASATAKENAVAAAEAEVERVQGLIDKRQETIDGYQREIDKIQDNIDAKQILIDTAQREIDKIDEQIDVHQKAIDNYQREIEMIDRRIEAEQRLIEEMERSIELTFNRPIEALQEESSDLANDLTLMDKAAENINKQYERQVKALEEVKKVNDQIINQQRGQISLADALSEGDISRAAQIMQEIRSSNAEAAAGSVSDALAASRDAAVAGLRSASGMTREQIEQRQFEISQQIYRLEEAREKKEAEILVLKDKIYLLEQSKIPVLDNIRVLEDAIYNLNKQKEPFITTIKNLEKEITVLKDQQYQWELKIKEEQKAIDEIKRTQLKTAEDQLKAAQADLKAAEDKVKAEEKVRDELEKTKQAAIKAAEEKNKAELKAIEEERKARMKALDEAKEAVTKLALEFALAALNSKELPKLMQEATKWGLDLAKALQSIWTGADLTIPDEFKVGTEGTGVTGDTGDGNVAVGSQGNPYQPGTPEYEDYQEKLHIRNKLGLGGSITDSSASVTGTATGTTTVPGSKMGLLTGMLELQKQQKAMLTMIRDIDIEITKQKIKQFENTKETWKLLDLIKVLTKDRNLLLEFMKEHEKDLYDLYILQYPEVVKLRDLQKEISEEIKKQRDFISEMLDVKNKKYGLSFIWDWWNEIKKLLSNILTEIMIKMKNTIIIMLETTEKIYDKLVEMKGPFDAVAQIAQRFADSVGSAAASAASAYFYLTNMPAKVYSEVYITEYRTVYETVIQTIQQTVVPDPNAAPAPAPAPAPATVTVNKGGLIRMASGGTVPGPSINKDVIPAMLTPGEFVINREATSQFLPLLSAINGGKMPSFNKGGILKMNFGGLVGSSRNLKKLRSGSFSPALKSLGSSVGSSIRNASTPSFGNNIRSASPNFSNYGLSTMANVSIPSQAGKSENNNQVSAPVYNYSMNFAINNPGADANQIANVVISKIQSAESQQIRGQATYIS